MSEQAPEAVELPHTGDAAFAALMDVLAPEEAGTEAGTTAAGAAAAGDSPAGADQAGGGQGAAENPGQPAAPAGAGTAVPSGGAAGGSPGAGAADATDGGGTDGPGGSAGDTSPTGGSGDRPDAWTAAAADIVPELDKLSTAFEERNTKTFQAAALEEVRTEHHEYFDALNKHPRLLVGQTVPALGREGSETLATAEDAREWQEALKHLLVDEINSRASKAMEESSDFFTTVHASISLFQNNPDLVPGTKDFDVELANRFATLATPYELRVDGKLQGYSIPVQPLIDNLRNQVATERAAAAAVPAPPVAPSPAAEAPGAPAATSPAAGAPDGPQAGIVSKAGSGEPGDDFSALFSTIDPSLAGLRI